MKQTITVKEIKFGEVIQKSIISNNKIVAKIIDNKLIFWTTDNQYKDGKFTLRKDVFDQAVLSGAVDVIVNYSATHDKKRKTTPIQIQYSSTVQTMARNSKKIELRDGYNRIPYLVIHVRNMDIIHGKPLWREDKSQTSLYTD